MHASVAERLARLAPDQRAAATAPPGPVLCVAPAGSGKTTTLVARVAWLVDDGADAGTICVVAFNRRAAEELTDRLDAALAPLGLPAGSIRVRTFHALGREMLAEAGASIEPLVDRDSLLRELFPEAAAADRGRLDLAFSRLKLDLRVTAADVASDPAPGPIASAFVAYERAIAELGGVDFDDLVVRALAPPPGRRARPGLLARSMRAAPRRRGAGPRPDPARAGPAARGAGQRRLPRWRRRPDDLWLAAGRCATRPRPRRRSAGPAACRPRDELPLPAARRRARGPPRRAQPRAVREADRAGTERRPGGWSSRPTRRTISSA